jgi:hypothetical protein
MGRTRGSFLSFLLNGSILPQAAGKVGEGSRAAP